MALTAAPQKHISLKHTLGSIGKGYTSMPRTGMAHTCHIIHLILHEWNWCCILSCESAINCGYSRTKAIHNSKGKISARGKRIPASNAWLSQYQLGQCGNIPYKLAHWHGWKGQTRRSRITLYLVSHTCTEQWLPFLQLAQTFYEFLQAFVNSSSLLRCCVQA